MAVNQQRKAAKLIKARAKAKERRKQRDRQQDPLTPSLSDFGDLEQYGLGNAKVEVNASERLGLRKMSDVLLELIEPLSARNLGPDRLLRLAQVGMIAWNLALIPEEQRLETFKEMTTALPPDVKLILFSLIERKLVLFPDDNRYVLEVVMKDEGAGKCTLQAMSAIPPTDKRS